MADDAKRRNVDKLIYGTALVVALVAGVFAVVNAADDGADVVSTDPVPIARPATRPDAAAREADAPPTGGVEIVEPPPGRSKAGPDYVPQLPEVPDLAHEPPPPPADPGAEDPRFAQLGVEMRILSRARELLGAHPAEALGVLDQHRRQHPSGVLAEEREAFTIEALLALEHVDEAERRYYDFTSRYPHSEFDGRLREMMLRPPHQVGAVGR